jgi:Ca2+-binding EF-hand superfamily protein
LLTEAFELFDADHDGKINLEEFEFFMNGFAKDMNSLRDNKIVKEMIEESQKYAGEDKLFEISKLV